MVVDYFLHTWDFNSWWRDPNKYADGNEVPLSDGDRVDLPAFYGAKKFHIQEKKQFPRLWDHLLYSFMQSIFLKRCYELENNFEYDLVVKARHDIIFPPEQVFSVKEVRPLTAYTSNEIIKFPNEHYRSDFHDVMFWGDSMTMDLIGDTMRCYANRKPTRHPINAVPYHRYGPGVILTQALAELGIHPVHDTNHFVYSVVREEAEKNNLDAMTKDGYDAIRDIMVSKYC